MNQEGELQLQTSELVLFINLWKIYPFLDRRVKGIFYIFLKKDIEQQ